MHPGKKEKGRVLDPCGFANHEAPLLHSAHELIRAITKSDRMTKTKNTPTLMLIV
jgi:hypothetical protein